jgi:outer membrane usher protein
MMRGSTATLLLTLCLPSVQAQVAITGNRHDGAQRLALGQTEPIPVRLADATRGKARSDLDSDSDTRQTSPATPLPAAGKAEVILPIYIDGVLSVDIFAVIEGKTNILLDAQTLLDAFYRVLREDAVNPLEQLRGAGGMIASRDLLQKGITVEFEPDAVVLNVHTPLQVRKNHLYNLHSHQQMVPVSAADAIRPASLSAAVDLFMTQAWLQGDRQPSTGEVDAHINLQGWVVQNRQIFDVEKEQHWQRRETRLTRDWPDLWLRLTAGDVSYKSIGLMGNRPLSGLSLGTSFELQPYSLTYPLSRHEFFLEQDSQVDLYINGSFQTRLQLPAGRHDILDLPLIQGINQVTLEITDALGRTRSLEFFETLDQRLLRPGLNEYSLTLGVPRTTDNLHGIDYETGMPALSAFYRTGLTEDLTIGGHLEVSKDGAMGGVTGVMNGLWGTLIYDVALSRDSVAHATGAGGLVDYLLRRRGWGVNANYRWEDPSFANLNQAAADNNTHYNARLGLTFPRVYDWSYNLSVGQTMRWDSDVQRSRRFSLSRSYPDGWRVSLDLSQHNDEGESEFDAALRVYWAPPGSRIQGNLGYTSQDHAWLSEVRYQRLGELGLDARAFRLDSDRQRLERVETSYVSSRLESRLSVVQRHPEIGSSFGTQSLSFGTALAYADGRFAVSRPLHGQPFALLSGKASLGDQTVKVIRGLGGRASAMINGAGASAVLPNLSPYYVNQVNLDVGELPMSTQIERSSYNVLLGYRSGVLLEIGAEGGVYLVGRLVDSQGQPLGYRLGQLVGPTGASGKPAMLFTDDQGHFEVAGVVPGRYRVRLDAPHTYRGEIHVPEEILGRLDIGDVVLKQR